MTSLNRAGGLLIFFLIITPVAAMAAMDSPAQIFMPDGQLKSHTVKMYITEDIQADQEPRLRLLRSHAVTQKTAGEDAPLEPVIVAPAQEWVQELMGQEVRRTGTLLLFDLSNLDFQYKAMVRVTPVVTWTENGTERVVVSPREVNLGSIIPAVVWTLMVTSAALALIIFLPRRNKGKPLHFLIGRDGHLSLSKTQVACWTVVIGMVVLGYSMIQYEVPEIPASLVALMGASLATGGIGYFGDAKKTKKAGHETHSPKLVDFLYSTDPKGDYRGLSLPKAQMIFWTLLLIAIFVWKSILDGEIWDVPWPLVALMGFSQVGYLAPKFDFERKPEADAHSASDKSDMSSNP